MSHQRAGHIYLMGRAQGAKTSLSCVELAIVVRIHTCVLVRPCCRCQALLPHRSTNDGVELPDGTPRGVRDLYPVWLPCFFSPFPATSPSSSPRLSTFHPSLSIVPRAQTFSLSLSLAVRAAPSLPRPRCFAKQTFVSARSTERETPSSSGTTLIDGESSPAFALMRLALVAARNKVVHSRMSIAF